MIFSHDKYVLFIQLLATNFSLHLIDIYTFLVHQTFFFQLNFINIFF
jgi:hypothetical protein